MALRSTGETTWPRQDPGQGQGRGRTLRPWWRQGRVLRL